MSLEHFNEPDEYLFYLRKGDEYLPDLSDRAIDRAIFVLQDYMFENGYYEEVSYSVVRYATEKGRRLGRES